MFDFDNDGSIEPWEVGIGASLIGMGGLALDAEETSYNDRKEYEDELDRKQRRIDELEDELKDLRHERDSDYLSDYYNDDDFRDDYKYAFDNDSDYDEYDEYDEDEDDNSKYRRLLRYFLIEDEDDLDYAKLAENYNFDYAQASEDGAFKPFGEDEDSAFIVFELRSWLKEQAEQQRKS